MKSRWRKAEGDAARKQRAEMEGPPHLPGHSLLSEDSLGLASRVPQQARDVPELT